METIATLKLQLIEARLQLLAANSVILNHQHEQALIAVEQEGKERAAAEEAEAKRVEKQARATGGSVSQIRK